MRGVGFAQAAAAKVIYAHLCLESSGSRDLRGFSNHENRTGKYVSTNLVITTTATDKSQPKVIQKLSKSCPKSSKSDGSIEKSFKNNRSMHKVIDNRWKYAQSHPKPLEVCTKPSKRVEVCTTSSKTDERIHKVI